MSNTMDIPGVGQHRDVVKAGFLNKLSGRSFPYIPQWKKRYCVLSKGKLFYYERSDSKAGEKGAGVINLEYFDSVSEAGPKDCKKATNVFIITSQDRSFFDPGRHMFSADTLPDMKDWMRKLQSSLEHIRNNNRTGFSSAPSTPKPTKDVSTGGSTERRKKNNMDNQNSGTSSRERNKKEQDSSQRRKKQSTTSVSSETQTQREADSTNMKAAEEPVTQEGTVVPVPVNELLPVDGPKLEFAQKRRVQGPRGRRNPKSMIKLSNNQRAISCSALEPGEQENNRSGISGSNLPTSIKEESENNERISTNINVVNFEDIDSFFNTSKDEKSSVNKNNVNGKSEGSPGDPKKDQLNSKSPPKGKKGFSMRRPSENRNHSENHHCVVL